MSDEFSSCQTVFLRTINEFHKNVCSVSLFVLTYRFSKCLAVFSANTKDAPTLPGVLINNKAHKAEYLRR